MKEVIELPNFAPDALAVRNAVVSGGFATERGPDGALYTGISGYPVPHWFDRIAELRNRPIRVAKDAKGRNLSFFRLNLSGELPHSWVHSDDICAKWASVLYMNLPEQCYGGTAFWRHRQLGLDRLPASQSEAFYQDMTRDWKEISHWQQIGFVPMEFNKFITYPTSLFHSRYPFESFGKGSEDGRLIWVCFYDCEAA